MSNKNYTKFSMNKEKQTTIIQDDVITESNKEIVEESLETKEINKEGIGIVSNCKLLYIRDDANKNSDVLGILDVNDKVKVYFDGSTKDFYKIETSNGICGYCMKEFIKIS